MNDLPLVSLGQGDYRREVHAADLAGKGVLGSIGLIMAAVLREPAKTYHANASRYLSSHALGEFRRCPLLYRRRRLGLVPDRDSPAYLLGRAAHTLILEGRVAYERAFAVGGPINPRTGQPYGAGTKAFAEWAASTGREGLDDSQASLVERMAEGVSAHEEASRLLAEGLAERVVRVERLDVACQARIDWISFADGGRLVDLKTCEDLSRFEADARRFSYPHQVAFYREVLAGGCGTRLPVSIVAVEKQEPFRVGTWHVAERLLERCTRENEAAIERLKRCEREDRWPTDFETPLVMDIRD